MAYSDAYGGIKKEAVGELSMEIMDYADKVYNKLMKINDKFNSLNGIYECGSFQSMKYQYSDLRRKFEIVKNNIMNYSNDLIALVQKMESGDKQIAKVFQNHATDTKVKSNQIESL